MAFQTRGADLFVGHVPKLFNGGEPRVGFVTGRFHVKRTRAVAGFARFLEGDAFLLQEKLCMAVGMIAGFILMTSHTRIGADIFRRRSHRSGRRVFRVRQSR
jgi:hypothetical protein